MASTRQTWLLATGLLVCSAVESTAYEFSVEGTARMRMFMPTGSTQEQATVHFTINVNDCHWLLRLVRDLPNAPDYDEVSFDGTNIYCLQNIRTGVESQQQKGVKLASNIANARVERGEVYHLRLPDEVGPIWLAYASACYFQKQSDNMVEAAMSFDASGDFVRPRPKELEAFWAFSDSQPPFLKHVIYMNDGQYFAPSAPARRFPAPFDVGFTNAIFQVHDFTNFAGLTAPLSASLKIFRPKPSGQSNTDLEVFAEYFVNLTSASIESEVDSFQPRIPGPTLVDDYRDGFMAYTTTNEWPTVSALRVSKYSRLLVMVGLGGVIILSALYFWINNLHTRDDE